MVETLWDAITRRATDFIEGGQERRQWLDDLGRKAEYYVPPELRNILGFAAEMTPTAAIDRAAQAGGEMLAPGRTPMQRLGSAGEMLSETAGVVAPAMVANRAAMPAAQAIQETLLGASMAADDVGRRFVERMNQPGPVPTMYSNPVDFNAFKKARAQEEFAGKVRSAVDDVSSGAYQARMDQSAFDLHKSGNLPLPVGTRVSPPSSYEMGSDLRISGYWVDPQDANVFGYKLQNEAGEEFREFVNNPRLGIRSRSADRFGSGFKAFAGPNADDLLGFSAPSSSFTQTAAREPIPDSVQKEYDALFGNPVGRAADDFNVTRKDASNIFGEGSERVRYTDAKSGGTMEVVVRPDGSASVLELEVPEASRGQGIGQALQQRVMQDFPVMGGQVSSKAAAKTAYRLGRRPYGQPDATLEDVFRMIDEDSSVNLISPQAQPNILPAPRNEAEAMAKQVLEMRAAGRAGDVTEEMMAATDPQYMFANTPLPMDEASRMARAAGRRDEFHGTTTGSDMTYADAFRGSGSRQGIGFVTSDNPYVASSYADPQFGSVFPMLNEAPPVNAPRLDVGGEIWSQIPKDLPVQVGDRVITARDVAVGPADVGGVFDTNQLSRGASFDYPAIEFSNISDRSIHAPRPRTDDGMAVMREFQAKGAEPSTVTMRHDTRGMRSRFARFDPEFSHLRNLSAGIGGLGILSLLAQQEQEVQ